MRVWDLLPVRLFHPIGIVMVALFIAGCAGPRAPEPGSGGPAVPPRQAPAQAWNPFIVSDPGGHIYVSYYGGPGGRIYGLYITRSADGGATWLPEPVEVETAQPKGRRIGFHKLESDGKGNVYVTWSIEKEVESYQWRTIEVRRRHSPDFGLTWPGPNTAWVPTSAINYPTPWTGSDGEMYMIWVEGAGNISSLLFNRTDRRGSAWLPAPVGIYSSPPQSSVTARAQNSPNSSIWPAAVHDSEGHLFVAWQGGRQKGEGIYFNRSLDRGATWSAALTQIDSSPREYGVSRIPVITTDGRHGIYVAWEDMRGKRNEPFFNRSIDGGQTWLPQDIRLSAERPEKDRTRAHEPLISADRQGRVYAAWKESGDDLAATIRFTTSMDRGSTWFLRPRQLDSHGSEADSDGLRLGHDDNGHVYVVWGERETQKTGTAIRFNRSSDYGESWLPRPIRLSNEVVQKRVRLPRMSVGPDGAIYVVWSGEREGRFKLFFNRSTDHGETWLPKEMQITP